MTISISLWTVLLVVQGIAVAVTLAWPVPSSRGDYDFGPAISMVVRLALLVIGSLTVWLGYFMAKALL